MCSSKEAGYLQQRKQMKTEESGLHNKKKKQRTFYNKKRGKKWHKQYKDKIVCFETSKPI